MTDNDNDLIFVEEPSEEALAKSGRIPWKVMIVDDVEAIHEMTMRVLDDFTFENQGIEFFNAYSGDDAKRLIEENPDMAVILLDVVMETDTAGLEVARHIREDLQNRFVRIILRTGQPGIAPEKNVIIDYDINDYKAKTELTVQKLFTTMVSSLRSYRDLRLIEHNLKVIEKNRKGLEQIIDSSAKLFELQSLKKFAYGVLTQLIAILHLDESSLYAQAAGFTASLERDTFTVQAATGKFKDCLDKPVVECVPEEIQEYLMQAVKDEDSLFVNDSYIGYFFNKKGLKHLLFLTGCRHLTGLDKDLIRIFSSNVAIAFENINLNREIVDTQKEVIFTLGEVVESRSKETARHVQRIAEFSYLLATKAGIGEEYAELLRLAAPMHDVGKIGIPDQILLKNGRLTDEEFEAMKAHTTIGYEILKGSEREILKTAALVAHQHQEKWDGTGYPAGLSGEEIHIFGRITGLVDVFDALIHRRCYKKPWEIDRAIALLSEQRGKHFDPKLVDIFLANIDEFLAINDRLPDHP